MTRLRLAVALLVVFSCGAGATAERCIGPMDNGTVAQSYGVSPITAGDITWCDDFDSYCSDNAVADSHWPGYPPTPDNLCAPGAAASESWFRDPSHWPKDLYTGSSMGAGTAPSRWEGWDGNPGWVTGPYTAAYQGGGNTAQYHVFDLAGAVGHKFPGGYDALNGTDANPLILRFWMYHSLEGAPPNSPLYLELKLDDARAPTDYVVKDCLFYHDCNCAALHQDASCATGTCQAPICAGSCGFYECNGTCSGGPRDGQTCATDSDCSRCVGGPRDGQTCSIPGDSVCKACDSGPNQGLSCTNDASCGAGTCTTGPRIGQSCLVNGDCGACVGGAVAGQPCSTNIQCQASCASGEQSTCDGGPHAGNTCAQDSECSGGPFYPIVSQQWLNGQITVPHPSLDPTRTWSSLAFGMLAQLDRDPCNLETGKKPTMYHAATFDGNKWYDIRSNVHLPGHGDFNYDWKQAFFEMRIETNYYYIRLVAGHGPGGQIVYEENTGRVERKYKGPFNKIAMGTGPGCQLDPNTGNCIGAADVWRYASFADGSNWHNGWVDRVAVLGGVPTSTSGACCLPDATCTETNASGCGTLGGQFKGSNTSCANTVCCPSRFGDTDADKDVDMADYAKLQNCLTAIGYTVTNECKCFDVAPLNVIDEVEVEQFARCAAGPGVEVNPGCN